MILYSKSGIKLAILGLLLATLIFFLIFFKNSPQKQVENTLRQLVSNVNAITPAQGAARLAYLGSLKNFSAPHLDGNWKNQRFAILNASEIPGVVAAYLKQYNNFSVTIQEIKVSVSSKDAATARLQVIFSYPGSHTQTQMDKNIVQCQLSKINGRWLIEKFSCLSAGN